jgi:ribosomal protein L11 methylase PrmA
MSQNRRMILPAIFILASVLLMGASKDKPAKQMRGPDVVYVGTAYDVVSKMLQMANVKKDDLVYDLGCGDGRMLVLAAQKYGCHGVGIDIDPVRVEESIANAKRNHVEELVKIIQEDIFVVDIKDADVIPMYLLPDMNRKLLPKLETLKKGSRIVTHDYGLDGIVADKTVVMVSNEDNARHTISLYITPLKRSKDKN